MNELTRDELRILLRARLHGDPARAAIDRLFADLSRLEADNALLRGLPPQGFGPVESCPVCPLVHRGESGD